MNKHKRLEYSPIDISIAMVGISCIVLGFYLFNRDLTKTNDFRLSEEFGVISRGNGSRKFGNSLQFFNIKEKETLYYGDVIFANEENPIEVKIKSDLSSKIIIPKDSMVKILKEGDEFNLDVSRGSVLFNSNKARNIKIKDKRGRIQKLKVTKNSQVKISTKKSDVIVEAIKGNVALQKGKQKPIDLQKGKLLLVGPKESKVVSKLQIIDEESFDPVFISKIKINKKIKKQKQFMISRTSEFKKEETLIVKNNNGFLSIASLKLGHYFIRFNEKDGYDEFDLKGVRSLDLKVQSKSKYFQGDSLSLQWSGRPELMYRVSVQINGAKKYTKLVQGNSFSYSLQEKGKYEFLIQEQRFSRKSNVVALDIDLSKDLDILAFDGKDNPYASKREIKLKNPRNKKFGFLIKDVSGKNVYKKTLTAENVVLPKNLSPGKYNAIIVNLKSGAPYYRDEFEVGDEILLKKNKRRVISGGKSFKINLAWNRKGKYPENVEYKISIFKKGQAEPLKTDSLSAAKYTFQSSEVGDFEWAVTSDQERLLKPSGRRAFTFSRPKLPSLSAPKIILKFLDEKDCNQFTVPAVKAADKYEVVIYSTKHIVKGKNKLMYRKVLSSNKDCISSTGEGRYLYKYRILDKWGRKSKFSPRGEIFFPISPLDDF